MTEIETRINELVTNFINEVSRLARAAALDTLNRALAGAGGTVVRDIRVGKPAKAASNGAAAAAAAKRAKGEKRPKAEIAQVQAKVLAHIRANPGQRIEQINKVLGTRTPDLALPLKKLIAEGAVDTKGARRATTYFPGDGAAKGAAKTAGKKRRGKGK